MMLVPDRLTRWWRQRFPRSLTLGEVAVGRSAPMPEVDPPTQRLHQILNSVRAWVTIDAKREIQALVQAGADLDAPFLGEIPAGPAPSAESRRFRPAEVTPLEFAFRRDLWDLLLLLIEAGASLQGAGNIPTTEQTWLSNDRMLHYPDAPSRTLPLWAAMVARADDRFQFRADGLKRDPQVLEVIDAALDAGAPVDLVMHGTTLLQQLVLCDPALARWDVERLARLGVATVDANGRNAMTVLWGEDIRNDKVAGFGKLLAAGVDPHQEDRHGTTPLHALMEAVDRGQVRDTVVLGILREHPDLDVGRSNRQGITPLMILQQATAGTGHLSDVLAATHAVVERVVRQEQATLRDSLDEVTPATGPDGADSPPARPRSRL